MENIDNVKLFIQQLDNNVSGLSGNIDTIISKSLNESISGLSQLERAKLFNNYSYSIISLVFSQLKASGVNTATHPIMKELNRIKSYMNRVKELETNRDTDASKKEVDTEATKRFIKSALGGGSTIVTGDLKPAISSDNFKNKHIKFDDASHQTTIKDKIIERKKKTLKSGSRSAPKSAKISKK